MNVCLSFLRDWTQQKIIFSDELNEKIIFIYIWMNEWLLCYSKQANEQTIDKSKILKRVASQCTCVVMHRQEH